MGGENNETFNLLLCLILYHNDDQKVNSKTNYFVKICKLYKVCIKYNKDRLPCL